MYHNPRTRQEISLIDALHFNEARLAEAAASIGAVYDYNDIITAYYRDDKAKVRPLYGKRDEYGLCVWAKRAYYQDKPWLNVVYSTFKHGGINTPVNISLLDTSGRKLSYAERFRLRNKLKRQAAKLAASQKKEADKKQQLHETQAKEAQALWNQTKTRIGLPYLIKKGLGDLEGHYLPQSPNLLIVPLRDIDGKIWSLQWLADHKIKIKENDYRDRSFMLHAHASKHFYVLKGTTEKIFIVEGIATGVSVWLVTGCTVVVAFTASNLPKVAETLIAHGWGNLVIAADNDVSDAGEIAALKTGLPYVMPDFIGIPNKKKNRATDWNDYHQEYGAQKAREALLDQSSYIIPDESFDDAERAAFQEIGKGNKRVPAQLDAEDLLAEVVNNHPILKLNKKTIDNLRDWLNSLIEDRKQRALSAVTITNPDYIVNRIEDVPEIDKGILLLNAFMGSGKSSYYLKRFTERYRYLANVIATAPTQALTREQAKKNDITHYQSDVLYGLALDAIHTMSCCVPSLDKKGFINDWTKRAQYWACDESEQQLLSLASKVCDEADFEKFISLIKQMTCAVFADANNSDFTVNFLKQYREDVTTCVIVPPEMDFKASWVYGSDSLGIVISEALIDLHEGKKIAIACESEKDVLTINQILQSEDYNSIGLTSKTVERDPKAKAFLNNATEESKKYDVVVYSPVMGSGVSVENEEYQKGYFIGSGGAITPAKAMQMMRRFRNVSEWLVAIKPQGNAVIYQNEATLKKQHAEQDTIAGDASSYDEFKRRVEAFENNQKADFAGGLYWLLEYNKFQITRYDKEADIELSQKAKAIRNELTEKAAQDILTAKNIDDITAEHLVNNYHRTKEEDEQLTKHTIKSKLSLNELNHDVISIWQDGRLLKQLDRFNAYKGRSLISPQAKLDDSRSLRIKQQWTEGYNWITDNGRIDLNDITGNEAEEVITRIIKRRIWLSAIGIVPKKFGVIHQKKNGEIKSFQRPKDAQRVIRSILEMIGLTKRKRTRPTSQVGRHPNKEKLSSSYNYSYTKYPKVDNFDNRKYVSDRTQLSMINNLGKGRLEALRNEHVGDNLDLEPYEEFDGETVTMHLSIDITSPPPDGDPDALYNPLEDAPEEQKFYSQSEGGTGLYSFADDDATLNSEIDSAVAWWQMLGESQQIQRLKRLCGNVGKGKNILVDKLPREEWCHIPERVVVEKDGWLQYLSDGHWKKVEPVEEHKQTQKIFDYMAYSEPLVEASVKANGKYICDNASQGDQVVYPKTE